MKKNITINLFGTLYAIDEDACQLLEQYTENMRSYFSKQEGGDEIIDDIEHRIAELLWENKENGQQAVDIQTIKNIINKIGDVEQMGAKNENTGQSPNDNHNDNFRQSLNDNDNHNDNHNEEAPRKLYRNTGNKMLGGVLSGLAQYFGGKDPLPWRIGYVVLFFVCLALFKPFSPYEAAYSMMQSMMPGDAMMGDMLGMVQNMSASIFSPYNFVIRLLRWSPIFAYLVLWAFVPEAKTVEDRLKMQGKRVDPTNIKKEVIIEHEQQSQPAPQQKQGCANGCLSVFVLFGKILGLGCLGCLGMIVVVGLLFGGLGWGISKIGNGQGFASFDFPPFSYHYSYTTTSDIRQCDGVELTTDIDLSRDIFNAVEFDGVGELQFLQGDTFHLTASGDSCYVSNLHIRVEDGCLYIDDKCDEGNDRLLHNPVVFKVTAPALQRIGYNGVGSLFMPDSIQQATDMTIELEGSVGSAEIANVACPKLTIRQAGVGDIRLRADTHELLIYQTGVGDLYLGGQTDIYQECETAEFTGNIYRDELTVRH